MLINNRKLLKIKTLFDGINFAAFKVKQLFGNNNVV